MLTLFSLGTSGSGTKDQSERGEVGSSQSEDFSWDFSSAEDLAGREDN